MRTIKIAFIAAIAICFFSFANNNSNEEGREQMFKYFLSQFKPLELPAKISFKTDWDGSFENYEAHQKAERRTILNEKFDDFIPGITNSGMGRAGAKTYRAKFLLNSNNNFTTLIYSSYRDAGEGSNTDYHLATFDRHGTEIDTKDIGYMTNDSYLHLNSTADMKMVVTFMDYDTAEKNFFPKTIKKMSITPKGEIMIGEERPFQKEDINPTEQQGQK